MTTEAFVKRGMERQELLAALFRDLLAEEARRKDPTFLLGVASVVFRYLQQRRHNSPRHASREVEESVSFCASLVLERIRNFTRSQAEDDALVAEFFEKIAQSITAHFRSALQREESKVPINGSS